MELTTIELSEVTVERSHYGKPLVRISQDEDLVVIGDDDVEEFVAAVREQARPIKEPEPIPEKWYVVLKNSNYRLSNTPGVPMMFTAYTDARMFARGYGGLDRTYCPISVDEYELAFGR